MNTFYRSVGLILLAVFGFVPQGHSEEARPNIIYLMLDEWGYFESGHMGHEELLTPNIDQFAKSARRFTGAYVQQAVCGPSRTALLTGLLPDHTRVWHNRNRFRETRPKHVTLPQLFKENGYRTLSLGKIFSGKVAYHSRQVQTAWKAGRLCHQ